MKEIIKELQKKEDEWRKKQDAVKEAERIEDDYHARFIEALEAAVEEGKITWHDWMRRR